MTGDGIKETEAKRRRRRKNRKNRKKKQRLKKPGQFCERNAECNGEKHHICDVASNASNSDTTCCGASGAVCGGTDADRNLIAPFCCAGYYCAAGTCQPVP